MNVQEDPFAAVRIRKIQPQTGQQQPVGQNQQDPFASVRVKKEEPSLIYETGRHAARIGSRISESLGGIPGDISSLIQSGIFAGLGKLTGHEISPEAREEAKKYRTPTTQELKETSEKLTGGFTKARDKYEEIGDEIASTAASLLGPMKFRKALWIAAGSQLTKEGIKTAGLGEGSQEAGKLGTMFLLSMVNPGGAMKYASSQYDKANQIAKGASIKASSLESGLKNLHTELHKGVTTSAKNVVIKPIEDLLSKINKGKIAVEELTAAKRDINTLMGDPALLKRERNLLKNVATEVDNAIKPFEKINPEFMKVYRPANEIYGAVMQGNKASNFISKIFDGKPALVAALTAAGEFIGGHPEAILPTIGGAAAVVGGAKAVDFLTRVAKSKELQKFYAKAMAAAVSEDAGALRFYVEKLGL